MSLRSPASRPNPATYVPYLSLCSKHDTTNQTDQNRFFRLDRVRRRSILRHRSRQSHRRAHPHRSRGTCARDASRRRSGCRGNPRQVERGLRRQEYVRAAYGRETAGGRARGSVWEQGRLCAHRGYGCYGAGVNRDGSWSRRRFEKVNVIIVWPFLCFGNLSNRSR